MRLQVEQPQDKARSYWKPLLIVFVIAGALLAGFQLMPKLSIPLSFEVTSFEGGIQIYDLQSRSWRAPKRGEEIGSPQKIKTDATGVVNLQANNEIFLRLKGNSEFVNKQCAVIEKKEVYKLHLKRGVLFGMTTKEFDRKKAAKKIVFQVTTPSYDVRVLGATFRVEASSDKGQPNRIGVMRGAVEASVPSFLFPKSGVWIRGLEQANVMDGVVQPAARVNQEEWGILKEAYELREKTAVKEAEQIDLSKRAGSFFDYVFDHGTFFTPKVGYAGREFYKDPDSGDVYLDAEYDVFPANSFVGVYIKTRNFDLAQYDGMSLEVRRNPEEGSPESFYIEVKSKGNVVRRFAPRGFERNWKKMQFDFHAQRSTPVTEVVFVFANTRVGEAKKGVLEFRNFNLIPRQVPLMAPVKNEAKVPRPSLSRPIKPQTVSKSETASAAPSPGVQTSVAAPVPFESVAAQPVSKTVSKSTAAGSTVQSPAVPKEIPLE